MGSPMRAVCGGPWRWEVRACRTGGCSCLSRSRCPHAGGSSCADQEQPCKVILLGFDGSIQ